MYAAFLQQHFAHSVNVPPAAKARYRASVSGPSAGLTAPSTGPEGEARSPGLVMMGGVGMINGSRGNKMAVIEASKERARQLALEKARAAAGIKDQEREERQPGSAGSDSSVDSLSSGSTATPGSTGTLGGRTPDVKVRIVKPEDGDLEVLEEEEQDEKMVDENDDEEMEDADHTTNTCRRRKSVDMTGAEGIKSSTVTFPGPGGRITGPGMSLMPAPKGKRRRIE